MTDFRAIIEEWATIYKPMQHTPGKTGRNKRFFLFDDIVSIPSFLSRLPDIKSPCVGYEIAQEGTIRGGHIRPCHVIYFLVRTPNNNPTDKMQSYEAQREAVSHMLKFMAWLRGQQDTRMELQNFNLESEEIRYSPYGPFLNNWYAIFIQLFDVGKFNLCVDPEDYVSPAP